MLVVFSVFLICVLLSELERASLRYGYHSMDCNVSVVCVATRQSLTFYRVALWMYFQFLVIVLVCSSM